MELREIIIDPEFRSLIPQLSPEEYNQLENNILEDGIVHDPLIVWAGMDILVDGHNRYNILREHPEIPYSIYEKEFSCRDEAIEWICKNQIGRRNITDMQKTILIGIAYEARKRREMMEHDKRGRFQSSSGGLTIDAMAREYGTSSKDVERSGRFVRGLKELEQSYPGTMDRIKNGELEVTKKDVMALTNMDEDDKAPAMKNIVEGKRIPITSPRIQEAYNINDFRSELHRKVESLDKSLELTCILTHKNMLDTEEGKEALNDTLLAMTEVIKKYFAYC